MPPLDALRAIHDELWDAARGMDRFAPGVVPGIDIAPFDLHSVRETALGAFLDLEDGNVDLEHLGGDRAPPRRHLSGGTGA